MVCEERDVSRESELGQHGGSIRGAVDVGCQFWPSDSNRVRVAFEFAPASGEAGRISNFFLQLRKKSGAKSDESFADCGP